MSAARRVFFLWLFVNRQPCRHVSRVAAEDKILFQGLEDDDEPLSAMSDINITDILNTRLGVGSPGGGPGSRPRTPAFRWFRDGSEFDASERFQCQFDDAEDTIALVFQHVTPGDAGSTSF